MAARNVKAHKATAHRIKLESMTALTANRMRQTGLWSVGRAQWLPPAQPGGHACPATPHCYVDDARGMKISDERSQEKCERSPPFRALEAVGDLCRVRAQQSQPRCSTPCSGQTDALRLWSEGLTEARVA